MALCSNFIQLPYSRRPYIVLVLLCGQLTLVFLVHLARFCVLSCWRRLSVCWVFYLIGGSTYCIARVISTAVNCLVWECFVLGSLQRR